MSGKHVCKLVSEVWYKIANYAKLSNNWFEPSRQICSIQLVWVESRSVGWLNRLYWRVNDCGRQAVSQAASATAAAAVPHVSHRPPQVHSLERFTARLRSHSHIAHKGKCFLRYYHFLGNSHWQIQGGAKVTFHFKTWTFFLIWKVNRTGWIDK